jgi:hypothetical protein
MVAMVGSLLCADQLHVEVLLSLMRFASVAN